jgi:hypothetical protein
MNLKQHMHACTGTITVAVRPGIARVGNTHTYVLNGTLMRDVLVDGKWVTHLASIPLDSRAA